LQREPSGNSIDRRGGAATGHGVGRGHDGHDRQAPPPFAKAPQGRGPRPPGSRRGLPACPPPRPRAAGPKPSRSGAL